MVCKASGLELKGLQDQWLSAKTPAIIMQRTN